MLNPIALAIPVFLALIGLEYAIARKQNKTLYVFNDFANNLSAGITEQLAGLFLKGFTLISYAYLASHHPIFAINTSSIWQWLALWLLVDFCYYWMHRSAHRCNFLWAGHSVHHQSEQYNLSVALRQGIIQTAFSWIFYLPIALLGYPLWMFALVASLNTLYQFWIHTTLIKKMGLFELIFNSPSHHRVHHGTNPQYIDKNYAGSLIIWDKLFGTFEAEVEPVNYGVTEPLDSWDPFYANIKVFADTLHYGQGLKSLSKKLLAFIMPPEWIVNQLGEQQFQSLKKPGQRIQSVKATNKLWLELTIAIIIITDLLFNFAIDNPVYWCLSGCLVIRLYALGRQLSASNYSSILDWLSLLCLLPVIMLKPWYILIMLSILLNTKPLYCWRNIVLKT